MSNKPITRRGTRIRTSGFTLIELLIVLAILLLLVAVALPRFQEAALRARVTQAWAEMRTLGECLEAYALDFRVYPLHGEILSSAAVNYPAAVAGLTTVEFLPPSCLTTPVRYLSSTPTDPTSGPKDAQLARQYGYINSVLMREILMGKGLVASANALEGDYGAWRLYASGPDSDKGREAKTGVLYTPTNGTRSEGDLVWSQKNAQEDQAGDES